MEKMCGAGLQQCHTRSSITPQNECSSSFAQQSIPMKDEFMGTAKIVLNTDYI